MNGPSQPRLPAGRTVFLSLLVLILIAGLFAAAPAFTAELPPLTEVEVVSTRDGTLQPSLVWAPESAVKTPTPMLVFVHSWSGDYRQDNSKWQQEAVERGWIYLHPNFRGPNSRPEACGSALARQDVLDAIDYAIKNYRVDTSRLYLAGSSGGGHMSMLLAGYYPERFSAVSAWVGISDLAEWYRFHLKDGVPQRYAKMVSASCGGPPGSSASVDAEYRARSPIFHLHNVGDLPLEIAAGADDGHSGSVPILHSLRAFNVVARAHGDEEITEEEMQQLWTDQQLAAPKPGDRPDDPTYPRAIFLRRTSGPARVTIFDGTHESLPSAACAWLEQHVRPTREVRRSANRKAAAE